MQFAGNHCSHKCKIFIASVNSAGNETRGNSNGRVGIQIVKIHGNQSGCNGNKTGMRIT